MKTRALVLGLGLAVLTAEGVARLLHFTPQTYLPAFGWVYQPGMSIRSSVEGFGTSHWAHPGIRRARPLGATEPPVILVVGDSFTEALQVDDDVVYTTVLEREIGLLGLNKTVINIGRASRSPADYVAMAALYQETFQPTWTIVQTAQADFLEDAWQEAKTHFARDAITGTLVVTVKKDPPPSRYLAGQIYHELLNRSALFAMTAGRAATLCSGGASEPPLFRAGLAARQQDDVETLNTGTGSFPAEEEVGLLARAYGKRLTILYLAALDPETPGQMTEFERRIETACAAQGIHFVSTRVGYSALTAAGLSPFGFANTAFNSGHLNATGHALVARLLSRELERLAADGLL